MVIREDGSKWACQSCLKGHRVSGCTHTDRELTLVPKKGRPVTQCQHCRTERKKRSAHVKCDCGEAEKPHHPKEKCIHLREAEERAKAGISDEHHKEEDPHHLISVAEEQGCCCHHGGKCSCSLIKRESYSQDGTPPHGPAVQKPRLETTRSDGSITVFANGHHKPVHKRNHAAHECGMPYKMPMPRAQTEQSVSAQARRSVDSLALDSNMSWNPAPFASPPQALFNIERRLSKSEETSPRHSNVDTVGTCSGGLTGAKLSSIDFSTLGPVQTNQSLDSAMSDSMFTAFDPMSGMTDNAFDPWSAFPSAESSIPNNNPFGVWPTNFEAGNVAQPALTAASSGTQSEIDEVPTMDDFHGFGMPSIQEDTGPFSVLGEPDDNTNVNRRSLPPSFFGNPDFNMPSMPNEWQTPVGSVHGSESGKSKAVSNDPTLGFVDSWQTPTMPSMSGISQRSSNVTSHPSRPTSQLMESAEAPVDDMMQQLFPEIDLNSGTYGLGNSATAPEYANMKRMRGLPMSSRSTAMDMSPVDDTRGFTSQPWSDGSLSVPNDTFASAYHVDDNFSSQDFTTWPYQ